jgi:hypothetical protein
MVDGLLVTLTLAVFIVFGNAVGAQHGTSPKILGITP